MDKFDVEVRPGPIAPDVRRSRQNFQKANTHNEAILGPRISAHLSAYDACLAELSAFHQQIADHSDLELDGQSRQAAAWLVAGRVVGLLNAAMQLAKIGFASEMVPILRTAHEAIQLLRAISMHRDPAILVGWLADRHIKPVRVRTAEDRNQKKIRAEMKSLGVEPPGRTRAFMDSMYENLSEMAHVRRSRVLEVASLDARLMPLEGHPAITVRAFFVYLLGLQVMEAVPTVGFAFGISRADEVVVRTQETFRQLQRLAKQISIDPETLESVR